MSDAKVGRVFLRIVGSQVVRCRYLRGEGWLSPPQKYFHNKINGQVSSLRNGEK